MTALAFVALAGVVAAITWPLRALTVAVCVALGIFTVLFVTTCFVVGLVHMIGIFVAGFAAGVWAEIAAACRRNGARSRQR